jgi:parallel beta-helix repeat protein
MRFPIVLLLLISVFAHAQTDIQKKLQNKFISAKNNDTIFIEAGNFLLNGSLWLDAKENVVIKGAGTDKTILSFKGQTSGAEGIKVTDSKNITICDLTVEDTKGDCIKTQKVDGINFINVIARWTGKPKESNGAYGFYPVQCSKVLIEGCTARGASDAGIYVGQSTNIIVRNCKAIENVAGIEIENSLYADVYNNEAFNNTGGILVFDMPDLPMKKGGFVKVYNNNVHDNNFRNFAPKGNIVGKVPPGTGVIILATNHVEVFENTIKDNRTMGIGIISYYITENPFKDKEYYPYPSDISIHHNRFERKAIPATMQGRMGKMFRFKLRFGTKVPHIIYDGIKDEKMKGEKELICIHDNVNESFAEIDASNDFKNISKDLKNYNCKKAPLKF